MKHYLRLTLLSLGLAASTFAAVQSCSSSDSDSAAANPSVTSAGQDLTQPFTLQVAGAAVTFPADSLAAGTVVTLQAGTQPSEFAPAGLSVAGASAVTNLSAVDANGAAVLKAVAPLTLALDLTAAAALADVEKTNKNLCVLVKGADGTLRRWANADLTIDETKKTVSIPSIWFGVFQALYCGDTAFADIAQVNADGSDVVVTSTPTTTPTTTKSSATTDGTCNSLVNSATTVAATAVQGTTPVGTGGTIENGVYTLTALNAYTASPIEPTNNYKQTLEITGGNLGQLVAVDDGAAEYRQSFTISPEGIVPNLSDTCNTSTADSVVYSSYTATATTFILYNSTYKFAVTYTKM